MPGTEGVQVVSVSGSGQLSWDLKDVQGVARPSSLTQEQVQMRGAGDTSASREL